MWIEATRSTDSSDPIREARFARATARRRDRRPIARAADHLRVGGVETRAGSITSGLPEPAMRTGDRDATNGTASLASRRATLTCAVIAGGNRHRPLAELLEHADALAG